MKETANDRPGLRSSLPKHHSFVSGNSYSMRPSGSLCGCGPETVPLTDRLNSRSRITFASRSARLPLCSHAKQPRFETSAWPSPQVSFRAPCLKQYQPTCRISVGRRRLAERAARGDEV